MTEAEARHWIARRFGERAVERLTGLARLVIAENERQNLIAPSTVEAIWVRHMLDSVQLAMHAREGLWVDVGTGGGFPGLAVALLRDGPMLLVEPRRRRAEFLQHCIEMLGCGQVEISTSKIENITIKADIVSARAVAPVQKLLRAALGCAKDGTRWLLPRGRLLPDELTSLQRHWRGVFHVEQSLTDPDSSILVLDGIAPR